MAFIVKDKIPINCQACFISRIGNICFCRRKITNEEWNTTNKRPDWCPLVEIPKGARLVDVNKILQILEEKRKEPAYQHSGEDWYVGLIDAEDCIGEAQIIFKEDD